MKMNATSLYVSTCRLIILADAADKSSWIDLFRLVPYLRQSLSCTVCGNLLKEPYTPTNSGCQHHVCKKCKGGRKKLKPSCGWCTDYDSYAENLQLRILLQCYKKLCEYFMGTDVYKTLLEQDEVAGGVNGAAVASSGLIELIQEGAGFSDNYKSTAGLSKSAYSILPCVYTNSASTQTHSATSSNSEPRTPNRDSPNSNRSVSNGSPLYSVTHLGSGNKITIKRKAVDDSDSNSSCESLLRDNKFTQGSFKKPTCMRSRLTASGKRKGCRCGNATATPGKLTCCGQRCPCYVESKPCTECKCKGCRNPHRPDGVKVVTYTVRPHIPQLDIIQITNTNPDSSPSCSGSLDSLDGDSLSMDESLGYSADLKPSNIQVKENIVREPTSLSDSKKGCEKSTNAHLVSADCGVKSHCERRPEETRGTVIVYSSQLQDVTPSLPATILMDEETPCSPDDDTSSPQDYTMCSPRESTDLESLHSEGTQDVGSDVEIDV